MFMFLQMVNSLRVANQQQNSSFSDIRTLVHGKPRWDHDRDRRATGLGRCVKSHWERRNRGSLTFWNVTLRNTWFPRKLSWAQYVCAESLLWALPSQTTERHGVVKLNTIGSLGSVLQGALWKAVKNIPQSCPPEGPTREIIHQLSSPFGQEFLGRVCMTMNF